MNRTLKLSLFCAGIFACGVIVGGFGARRLAPRQRPPGFAAEGFGLQIMRKLAAELDLTKDQRAAIDPVIHKAGEELRVVRRESVRQTTVVIEAMDAAIAAQLTPAQREKFTALKAEQRARMKSLMEERQRRRGENGEREPGGGPGRPSEERDSRPDARDSGDRPPPPAPAGS